MPTVISRSTRLRIPGETQMAVLTADVAATLGNAELHALVRGLKVPGAQPAASGDDPVKIEASVRLDDPARRWNSPPHIGCFLCMDRR